MSTLSGVALPRPKDWQDFERKTKELFVCVLNDPNTQLHGRTGQPQHGIDIWGHRNEERHRLVGIQCKKSSDRIAEEELEAELEKAKAFNPPIAEFILVTTAPRDAKIQQKALELTTALSQSERPIFVAVWGWDDIEEHAANHVRAHQAFDPTFNPYAARAHDELLRKIDEFHISHDRQRRFRRAVINSRQVALPPDPNDIGPTDLLQAKYGVVPYIDARKIKADIIAWCRDETNAVAARLIHGPGGSGKTRLLIEVTAALRPGWTAGFVDRLDDQSDDTMREHCEALEELIRRNDHGGLLLVIDYAESRITETRAIARLLDRNAEDSSRPIRLILLARTAGGWWTELHDESPDIRRLFRRNAFNADILALSAILTRENRRELFTESIRAFAPVLEAQGYLLPMGGPSDSHLSTIETRAEYSRPLAVYIAALLWLVSENPGPDVHSVDRLLNDILALERGHWEKLVVRMDADEKRDLMRGVAQVTVVQGTTSAASTERLLLVDRFYEGQRTSRIHIDLVMRNLARIYGKADGGITHLEPDLIGEHHIAMVGDVELIDGCLRWMAAESKEARNRARHGFLVTLQRATHGDHGASAQKAWTLLEYVVQQLHTQIELFDDGALASIDAALPSNSVLLKDFSLRIAQQRVVLAREFVTAAEATEGVEPEIIHQAWRQLALRLDTVSARLSRRDRVEEAVSAQREGVEIYRWLAEVQPETFLEEFATSTNNFGNRLALLGDDEAVLAASQEVVEIYRRLAEFSPDAYRPFLGVALANHTASLLHLGRHEETLVVAREAVDIYLGTAGWVSPDASGGSPNAVYRLADHLAELGRDDQSLSVPQSAAEVCRRLARGDPDAFLPDLAGYMLLISGAFSMLGRLEEALATAKGSVGIRWHLAQIRPDIYLPDLAKSLDVAGHYLVNLGQPETAVGIFQQSVEIRQRILEVRPGELLSEYVESLDSLGAGLVSIGQHEQSVAVSQRAVEIYRRLAEGRPAVFLQMLANGLNTVAAGFFRLTRYADALAAWQESITIIRRLAETDPDQFLVNLAQSLAGASSALGMLGRHDEAVAVSQEAVDKLRPVALTSADAFLPRLSSALNNLGAALFGVGRQNEAIGTLQEAVSIQRRLAQVRPETFLPELARSLGALARIFATAKRYQEAADIAREGAAAVGPCVQRYPEMFGDLARAIGRTYLDACTALGAEPDYSVLESVAQGLKAEQTIVDIKAKIGAVIQSAEKAGVLDEEALAELPPHLAEQLRAGWAARSE
jgi:tetratricopeptide (TPR) repeat protein